MAAHCLSCSPSFCLSSSGPSSLCFDTISYTTPGIPVSGHARNKWSRCYRICSQFSFCFFFVITERTEQVGCRAKTFDFYSEGPGFESRLEHRLSSLSFCYLHQQLHVDSEIDSRKRARPLPLCLL